MKINETQTHTCPKCNNTFTGHPALARSDNTTFLCSDCGTREALESIGVAVEEQDKIIDIIHRWNQ